MSLPLRHLITAIALCCSVALAQAPKVGTRPMTFEDMMALKRLGDPTISPDGKWVMYSAVDVSLQNNTRQSHLWIVLLDGGAAKPLTSAIADRGRFSPDGYSILF
ncbi:MAG TPA: S9 family peptidase, partial [Terriglobales bacterium]